MATSPHKTRRLKLDHDSNGSLRTPEEFDAVREYDDLYKYELVHGVVIVSPFAAATEQDPCDELGHLLRNYAENHPLGPVLDATLFGQSIRFRDNRRCVARAIWAGLGRLPDTKHDVPTIAVEFVSRGTRDRVRDYEEKRREYMAAGVKEYWVIDRFRRTMTVFRQPPAVPAEEVIPADGTYRTPLLPGFELPLARLLAVADRWKRPRKAP